jgi:hypothetical protein
VGVFAVATLALRVADIAELRGYLRRRT